MAGGGHFSARRAGGRGDQARTGPRQHHESRTAAPAPQSLRWVDVTGARGACPLRGSRNNLGSARKALDDIFFPNWRPQKFNQTPNQAVKEHPGDSYSEHLGPGGAASQQGRAVPARVLRVHYAFCQATTFPLYVQCDLDGDRGAQSSDTAPLRCPLVRRRASPWIISAFQTQLIASSSIDFSIPEP